MSVKTVTQKLTLKEWIEKEGAATVAKLLKVNESAVRHWRRGFVLPRAEQMIRIRDLSRGAVCIEEMIETHLAPKNKKNRWHA